MRALRIALARVRALFRRNGISREIRDEMQFHVDMRADEYARDGLTEDDARRSARRRFGNLALMQDRGYDVRGGGFLETVVQDVRYAIRLLIKDRAFSAVAILTLALGIGLSTALFSVIDAALIRPLPYPHPEELVDVLVAVPQPPRPDGLRLAAENDGFVRLSASIVEVRAWRASGTAFTHVGMGRSGGIQPVIVDADEPERLTVGSATEDFLEVYGVQPVLGRLITLDDTREGAPSIALLGHAYWRSRFGGDPNVLGRTVRVENEPVSLVGVLPPDFFPRTALWRADRINAISSLNRRGSGTPIVARLRQGISLRQAESILSSTSSSLAIVNGGGDGRGQAEPVRVGVTSLYDLETHRNRSMIGVLTSAVALILVIACANVAGLLLGRGVVRRPELAIRTALGAGRRRLVRQLLTECILLSGIGAALGVALAYVCVARLVSIVPISLPENSVAGINLIVLAFALVVSIASALVFGLVPAMALSRTHGLHAMSGGRRHGGALSKRAGGLLVGIEVALAVVLLAGAGLMLRSFSTLAAVDLGFDPASVLTMEVEPIDPSPAVRREFYPRFVEALQSHPAIAAAGAIDALSLRGGSSIGGLRLDGGAPLPVSTKQMTAGYFEALGIAAVQGRLPEPGRSEAVVNVLAAKRFGDASPLGQGLIYSIGRNESVRMTIVGVVPDIRHQGPLRPPAAAAYLPANVLGQRPLSVVVRFARGASIRDTELRNIAASVGVRSLVGRIGPATEILGDQVAVPRRRTVLLGLLGLFGVALTFVGIFSVTAYAVSQRTQEIGVRMAFGARASDVVASIVRDTLSPVVGGLALGLLGAFYATELITSFLFETKPRDPVTFASVAALMLTTALVAAWLPARRAARVDPVVALRAE